MNPYWIKFIYERKTYVVDLNRINSFVWIYNGRLMFWLPDGKVCIIIHPKTNPDTYQQVLEYVEQTTGQPDLFKGKHEQDPSTQMLHPSQQGF